MGKEENAMTSSNVAGVLLQQMPTQENLSMGKTFNSDTDLDFTTVFFESVKANDAKKDFDGSVLAAKSESVRVKIEKSNTKPQKMDEKNSFNDEKVSEIADKVNEFASDVKETISKELDISQEDIENAMELLGLTNVDLLNPQNIVSIIATLNNTDDSVSLLLDDSFKTIFDSIGQLFDQLQNELDLMPQEIRDVLIELEPVEESIEVNFEEIKINSMDQSDESVDTNEVEIVSSANTFDEVRKVSSEQTEQINETVDTSDEMDEAIISGVEEAIANSKEQADDNKGDDNLNNASGKDDFLTKSSRNSEIKDSEPIIFSAQESNVHFEPQTAQISLPDGQLVDTSRIIDQIVEQAKIMNSAGEHTMEMVLNPEGLGKIFLEVTQKGDEVSAKLFTTNEAVKEALENQMATLRNDMNQGGTKVTSIEVSVGAHEFERNLEQDEHSREEQERNRQENRTSRRVNIDLNNLDGLSGLMSEEERLVAQIMRDNGNSVNYTA